MYFIFYLLYFNYEDSFKKLAKYFDIKLCPGKKWCRINFDYISIFIKIGLAQD